MSKDKDLRTEIHMLAVQGAQQGQRVANIEQSVADIKTGMEKIAEDVKQTYVTNHRFEPVRLIAYGIAGGILTCVLGAILAMVVITPKTYVSIEKTYVKPSAEILQNDKHAKD